MTLGPPLVVRLRPTLLSKRSLLVCSAGAALESIPCSMMHLSVLTLPGLLQLSSGVSPVASRLNQFSWLPLCLRNHLLPLGLAILQLLLPRLWRSTCLAPLFAQIPLLVPRVQQSGLHCLPLDPQGLAMALLEALPLTLLLLSRRPRARRSFLTRRRRS